MGEADGGSGRTDRRGERGGTGGTGGRGETVERRLLICSAMLSFLALALHISRMFPAAHALGMKCSFT
jgi:hypothetical protein